MAPDTLDRKRLLIKNFPDNIPNLNEYFQMNYGASDAKKYGRRRVIVKFPDENLARNALYKLHQNELENRILSVEYIGSNPKQLKDIEDDNKIEETNNTEKNKIPEISDFIKNLYGINSKLGFNQPPPPYLKYNYPKINRNILDSISISLLTIPKFYVQVLHLMNRMNLDPPFLPLDNQSTFISSTSTIIDNKEIKLCDVQTQTDNEIKLLRNSSKLLLASDESELESDIDDNKSLKNDKLKRTKKRKQPIIDDNEIIKKKAKKLLQTTRLIESIQTIDQQQLQHQNPKTSIEIFEKNQLKSQKIELNITNLKLPEKINMITEKIENEEESLSNKEDNEINQQIQDINITKFITDDNLKQNRISEQQLKELPLFKNYQKGEKSNKLYIKNLHKDVTEDDLKMIYGRFAINQESIMDEIHIKLMQYGKMKGQAFITFIAIKNDDNLDIVEKALNETNGYILKNKPMVVCYGKKRLLETIYVDGANPQNSSSSTRQRMQITVQPFEYIIAIDFEATCWENEAPPKWRESEIIEFPAVLINLKTGKIESEFQKYIMPIESPKLSAFCIQLTGIKQNMVDNGIPLQTALMMFQEWLRKELRNRNLILPKMSKQNIIGNCAFVTWSDWDLGNCLAKECQRKHLKKPQYFNQWCDLKSIFKEWYKFRPLNFQDALNHVGMEFEGRQHCGLDDAKNIAKLAYKMVKDGATLSITKDLTPFQVNMNIGL